jgi:hypothetical protein
MNLFCLQESEVIHQRKVSFMKQEVIMKTESSSLASATVQRQETQALELVERSLSQGKLTQKIKKKFPTYSRVFF